MRFEMPVLIVGVETRPRRLTARSSARAPSNSRSVRSERPRSGELGVGGGCEEVEERRGERDSGEQISRLV